MTIDRLRDALTALGPPGAPPVDAVELSEMLWLACQISVPEPDVSPADLVEEDLAVPGLVDVPWQQGEIPPPPAFPSVPSLAGTPPAAELHPPSPEPGDDAVEVLVPTAPMLANPLGLQRALRPLKRRVPSGHRRELDEETTAARIADSRLWAPVLVPEPERWLTLGLVVDTGPSMRLWRPLARELTEMLQRQGAFRDVRVDRLGPSGRLSSGRDPATLLDPSGRHAVLLLSDCSGPHWWNGRAARAVRRWAEAGPTAILQPLPEHLWRRTAAPATPGLAVLHRPGGPNTELRFTPYDGEPAPGLPVPVLEIAPRWFAGWSALVSGSGPQPTAITTLPAARVAAPVHRERELPVEERVRRFLTTASPAAAELAAHVAVSVPSLPVMRLIQHRVLGGTGPGQLAEVLLSGLLRPVDGERYEFVDGAREALLDTLARPEALHTRHVLEAVSAEIERRAGTSAERFHALIRALGGEYALPPSDRRFALLSPQARAILNPPIEAPSSPPDLLELIERDGEETILPLGITEAGLPFGPHAPWSSSVGSAGYVIGGTEDERAQALLTVAMALALLRPPGHADIIVIGRSPEFELLRHFSHCRVLHPRLREARSALEAVIENPEPRELYVIFEDVDEPYSFSPGLVSRPRRIADWHVIQSVREGLEPTFPRPSSARPWTIMLGSGGPLLVTNTGIDNEETPFRFARVDRLLSSASTRPPPKAVIGRDEAGEPVVLDPFGDVRTGPHGLVIGRTEERQAMLRTVVSALAATREPRELRVVFGGTGEHPLGEAVGPTHLALVEYVGLTVVEALGRPDRLDDFIGYLGAELDQRRDIPVVRPLLLVVVDVSLTVPTSRPRLGEMLLRIAQSGRELGVHLILGTSELQTTTIWARLLKLLNWRIAVSPLPPKESLTVLGRGRVPEGAHLRIGGEAPIALRPEQDAPDLAVINGVDTADRFAFWAALQAFRSQNVFIGVGDDGMPVPIPGPGDPVWTHGLIEGDRQARERALLIIALGLAFTFSPAQLVLAVTGMPRGPIDALGAHIALRTTGPQNSSETWVATLVTEMTRRRSFLRERGALSWEEHRERDSEPLPMLIVLADLSHDADHVNGLQRLLYDIAQYGHLIGMRLFLATEDGQGPDFTSDHLRWRLSVSRSPGSGTVTGRITTPDQTRSPFVLAAPPSEEDIARPSAHARRFGSSKGFLGPLPADRPIPLGRDSRTHDPVFVDFDRDRHLLISGATGSGKASVLRMLLIEIAERNADSGAWIAIFDPGQTLYEVARDLGPAPPGNLRVRHAGAPNRIVSLGYEVKERAARGGKLFVIVDYGLGPQSLDAMVEVAERHEKVHLLAYGPEPASPAARALRDAGTPTLLLRGGTGPGQRRLPREAALIRRESAQAIEITHLP